MKPAGSTTVAQVSGTYRLIWPVISSAAAWNSAAEALAVLVVMTQMMDDEQFRAITHRLR
ncbi:hypothetical protein Ate01nite_72300 [Actinoplanes teichomyceticus]|nr:hypothetical protein Ate01nite_72300 [Actinoplanes teichomyceticus]